MLSCICDMYKLPYGKAHKDPCSVFLKVEDRSHTLTILFAFSEKENIFYGDVKGSFGYHKSSSWEERVSGSLKQGGSGMERKSQM